MLRALTSAGKRRSLTQIVNAEKWGLSAMRSSSTSVTQTGTSVEKAADPPLWDPKDGYLVLDEPSESAVIERLSKQEDWSNIWYATKRGMSSDMKYIYKDVYKNRPTEQYPPEIALHPRGGATIVEYVRVPADATEKDVLMKRFEAPKREEDVPGMDSIKQWAYANSVLYGPERDMKNFPVELEKDIQRPPVLHGYISEKLVNSMYNYSGVTGFYVASLGALLAVFAKGFLFPIAKIPKGMYFGVAFLVLFRRQETKQLLEDLKRRVEKYNNKFYEKPMEDFKEFRRNAKGVAVKSKEMLQHRAAIYDIHSENLDLQLENNYRERLKQINTAVKSRLDCQVAIGATKVELEKDHMVNWISDKVLQSITPELEKKNIKSCIEQLRVLSKTASI